MISHGLAKLQALSPGYDVLDMNSDHVELYKGLDDAKDGEEDGASGSDWKSDRVALPV